MNKQMDLHRLASSPTCCPKCGVRADFIPVKTIKEGGIEFEVLKCRHCGYEFELEIVTEPEPLECCSICGKDLFCGDEAAGVTLGAILEDYHGFRSDDEPWD